MDVAVAEALDDDRTVIRRLLQLYHYDFSEFDDSDVNPHGEYLHRYLDEYWTSRMASRWPACRAVSSTMWISIQRRVAPPAGHVGVLRVFAELRADGRMAQEEHVEPQVLGPAQVGHDARHRHQGRSREHGPVGIRFGQPFALQRPPAGTIFPARAARASKSG